jgi:hypothetical protein
MLLSGSTRSNGFTKLQSALYWASSRGHLKLIKVLIEHESPLLDASRNRSALGVAIQGGFIEACEVLFADRAEPNYTCPRTPPPLVLAVAHKHVEILVRLLRHGSIDVHQTGALGYTAVTQACRSRSDQCFKELLGDVLDCPGVLTSLLPQHQQTPLSVYTNPALWRLVSDQFAPFSPPTYCP